MEEKASGAGYPPAHFTGAAMATTKSDTCQRPEYGKEAAALVGGQASRGPAPAKDGHGTSGHGHPQREEGGDETLRREQKEQEMAD